MSATTATKAIRSLLASTSNAAASTTNSSVWDLSTTVGDQAMALKMTNGGTGPTIACTATVQWSDDGGTTWYTYTTRTGTVTASAVSYFTVIIPAGFKTVRVSFGANTAQAVTVQAWGNEVTSLATA